MDEIGGFGYADPIQPAMRSTGGADALLAQDERIRERHTRIGRLRHRYHHHARVALAAGVRGEKMPPVQDCRVHVARIP